MKPFLSMVTLALFFSVLPTSAARAEPHCEPRKSLLEVLAKRYQEQPIAIGLTQTGSLIEVLSSPSGRTWSLIVSLPDGQTCLVASGENWRIQEVLATDPHA